MESQAASAREEGEGPGAPRASEGPNLTWRQLGRRLGPVGVLAGIAMVLPPLGGFLLLGTMGYVGPWLAGHGWLGVGLYVAGFTLLAGFALLPTYAQALLAGWAFGFAVGFPAALLGFTGASLLGFTVAWRFSGHRVTDLIEENPKWKAVYEELLGAGFGRTLLIVTLIRLPPNSPFALTNLVMAAARVPWWPYVLGTVLGMAPRTGAAVFVAMGLSEFDPSQARQTWLIVAGMLVTVAVVIVIGLLANRALRRVTRGQG